ncbi:hypothetical protein SCATT_p16590 (plasmid) [Streptantibioticus cattleyicolor NRRL 8057 = DSM 46488]|uniref:Uncharacterized protein n=1 Tax=Streptantibioticus cattleyicolor (strain ATCC 35852 / DSM 46488 / JCM 4925 / NBRC 14057 / NRRL 8057) TaxID=1003195 RepID=G8XHL5_STREN|nr:hypothetical protein SCATT_p16590 [Streptantibioticus cattleyicolor NRRL 8057 = DSM 46488]
MVMAPVTAGHGVAWIGDTHSTPPLPEAPGCSQFPHTRRIGPMRGRRPCGVGKMSPWRTPRRSTGWSGR